MHLVTKTKSPDTIIALSFLLTLALMSCVSTEITTKSVDHEERLSNSINTNLVFDTIYDSEEKCIQENFGFTWQDIENDLNKYNIDMDKVHWLMSPYTCTKVKYLSYDNAIIYELYDRNHPIHLFYIHKIGTKYSVLATVVRDNYLQNISDGNRLFFGDLDDFQEGEIILNQFISNQKYK